MLSLYKKMVLWNCRVLSRIPGYRTYGSFMLRCYTKRFWTTWFINIASSVLMYFGMLRLIDWIVNRSDERSLHRARGLKDEHVDQGDPDLVDMFASATDLSVFDSMYASLHD